MPQISRSVAARSHGLKYAWHVPGHAYQKVRAAAASWPTIRAHTTTFKPFCASSFFAHFNLCQIVAKMQNALCARRHLNPFRAFHYRLLPNVLILRAAFLLLLLLQPAPCFYFPFVALLTQFCAFVFMCVCVCEGLLFLLSSYCGITKTRPNKGGEMAKMRGESGVVGCSCCSVSMLQKHNNKMLLQIHYRRR